MAPPNKQRQQQPHSLVLLLFIIFLHIAISFSKSSPKDDEDSLLRFKQSIKDDYGGLSSWNPSTPPCFGNKNNWVGIICSKGGSVWGLRLENLKLSGSINIEPLAGISKLRSISLNNNNFNGPLPDFRSFKALKAIFLSNNQLQGPIAPDAFNGMRRLRKLDLSNNKFSGEIPVSLANLGKLIELKLDGNQFQGAVPDFKSSTNLRVFDVSKNQLQGSLPPSLTKFDPKVFSGNKELCGPPLGECTPTANTNAETPPLNAETTPTNAAETPPTNAGETPPKNAAEKPPTNAAETPAAAAAEEAAKSSDNNTVPIPSIAAGIVVAILLAILLFIVVFGGKKSDKKDPSKQSNSTVGDLGGEGLNNQSSDNVVATVGIGGKTNSIKGGDTGGASVKLTFVKEDRLKFDMTDLLKASAEILGSGWFGSSYKAAFSNGDAVVVKRFKQMNHVGREEFTEHMRRLGRLSHPNILPLVAYYYRKEEKLFITEPVEKGSLAVLLHGQRRGKLTIDWATRLRIIKGVAKGLSYLYKELSCLVAPHGHLKSSNVLLNGLYEPVLSDYALIPLINPENVQELMVAYKSPEYFNTGRITKKTDIWSLGILIIEVLTGKFPASSLQKGSEADLTAWVGSVVNEGFDKSMGKAKNSEGQMQKLLDIGMACVESNADKRLDIKEACERIEGVHDRDDKV